MFRPLRKKSNAADDAAARELLARERRGVLAVAGDDGYPYAVPVNYFYDADAGKIYLHGSKRGHKVDANGRNDKVCFTVYGNEHVDQAEPWAPYMQSAVVFGRCKLIDDAARAAEHVRRFALKYYPSAEAVDEELAHSLKATCLYEITIEHLTGKQVQEK